MPFDHAQAGLPVDGGAVVGLEQCGGLGGEDFMNAAFEHGVFVHADQADAAALDELVAQVGREQRQCARRKVSGHGAVEQISSLDGLVEITQFLAEVSEPLRTELLMLGCLEAERMECVAELVEVREWVGHRCLSMRFQYCASTIFRG